MSFELPPSRQQVIADFYEERARERRQGADQKAVLPTEPTLTAPVRESRRDEVTGYVEREVERYRREQREDAEKMAKPAAIVAVIAFTISGLIYSTSKSREHNAVGEKSPAIQVAEEH